MTDALEEATGGPEQAFRLLRIYRESMYAVSGNRYRLTDTRKLADVFCARAKAAGFTRKAAELMLRINGK